MLPRYVVGIDVGTKNLGLAVLADRSTCVFADTFDLNLPPLRGGKEDKRGPALASAVVELLRLPCVAQYALHPEAALLVEAQCFHPYRAVECALLACFKLSNPSPFGAQSIAPSTWQSVVGVTEVQSRSLRKSRARFLCTQFYGEATARSTHQAEAALIARTYYLNRMWTNLIETPNGEDGTASPFSDLESSDSEADEDTATLYRNSSPIGIPCDRRADNGGEPSPAVPDDEMQRGSGPGRHSGSNLGGSIWGDSVLGGWDYKEGVSRAESDHFKESCSNPSWINRSFNVL